MFNVFNGLACWQVYKMILESKKEKEAFDFIYNLLSEFTSRRVCNDLDENMVKMFENERVISEETDGTEFLREITFDFDIAFWLKNQIKEEFISTSSAKIILPSELYPHHINCFSIVENKEELKMGEGQSRYGIMEELNNRKINEKEKLANIERETDQKIYDFEKKISGLKTQLNNQENSYVQNYKDRQRQRKVVLELKQAEFDRFKASAEAEMKEDEETYESAFQEYKKEMLNDMKNIEEEKNRYQKVQNTKIDEKKAIISEIDAGMNSLKEISKEQKTKE